jgi:hypothetical protein
LPLRVRKFHPGEFLISDYRSILAGVTTSEINAGFYEQVRWHKESA